MKLSTLLLTITIALTLNNCASKPTHLDLTIVSGQHLNPNKNNAAAPLMLHFFELKSTDKFLKSDFWGLTDESKKRLDNDLIAQAKHIIVPNEEQTYRILLNEESSYFGVVGSFRNIDNKNAWRYLHTLDSGNNEIDLSIDGYTIKAKQ